MKITVVGDSYIGLDYFRSGFEALELAHEISYIETDEPNKLDSASKSKLRIHEYLGSPAQLSAAIGGAEVLVVHAAPVTEEVLAAATMLRLICCARGGPTNIDLRAASARGLPVVTTPGKNAEAVADQTIAFMVMLARRIPAAQSHLANGGRIGDSAFEGREFVGEELGGRVLGLVGYGQVGRRVAVRALAFGMKVITYDPFVDLNDDCEVRQVGNLSTLLERASFVSLHARATADNENLMSRTQFDAMPRGGYFINTARETLVDESALGEALASGHLGGAALDVVRQSSASGEVHRLLRHPNVVLTPHIGGATEETLKRGVTMIANEIDRFTAGTPLLNVINREAVGA